jgi:integrase
MKGHVFPRGRKWSFKFDGPPDPLTGERRQVSKGGFASEREAWAACRSAIQAVETGVHVRPSKRQLGDFLTDEWLPAMKHVIKPTTLASYEDYARAYVVPVLGNVRLQEQLTAPRLAAFYDHLLTKGRTKRVGGLSPKTVRNVHVMLRKALADAVAWGFVTGNPAERVRPPRIPRRPPAVWAPESVARFLTLAEDDRFFALYLLAATTGMRRAELCGLRWPAVDLDRGTLSVSTTRVVVRGHAQDSDDTKSERGRRLLALDPITVDGLWAQRDRQDEERPAFGTGYGETDLVFTWEDGRPVHPDVIRQRFNRLVTRLKLPPIRLHDLRHSYASAALSAGIHPKVVSERLGHASVAFTLTQYSHVLPGVDQEAANTVADLMLGRRSVPKSVPNEPGKPIRTSIPEDERPDQSGSGGRI